MADKVYLQWTFPNWITVVLMAALGATIIGFVSSGLKTYQDGATEQE